MKKEDEILKKCGTGNPFIVPEGYFETLTTRIMDSLPEKKMSPITKIKPTRIIWHRRRLSWLYMAAAFFGLVVTFSFVYKKDNRHILSAQEQQAKVNVQQQLSDQDIEMMVDNSHMDDYTLYQYLSDAK